MVGSEPMKLESLEVVEARTSSKRWSTSIVIGGRVIFEYAVIEGGTKGNGVVEDNKVRVEGVCGVMVSVSDEGRVLQGWVM